MTKELLAELLVYKRLPIKRLKTKFKDNPNFKIQENYIELGLSKKWVKYTEYIIDKYRENSQPVFAIEIAEKFQEPNIVNILKGKEEFIEKFKVGNMVAWEPSWGIKALINSEGREHEMAQT